VIALSSIDAKDTLFANGEVIPEYSPGASKVHPGLDILRNGTSGNSYLSFTLLPPDWDSGVPFKALCSSGPM